MADAFRAMLAEGSAAVIVGTDCPALDPNILVEAFNSLRTHDLVLGPASDGGYYLIGLRKLSPGLFEGISWGTDVVLAETRSRAEVLGLSVRELAILDDVDEPKDLAVWEQHRSCVVEIIQQKPSLSVVIPTLNEEARIAATIESARRDGVEIIVADGGSSDTTTEIASGQGRGWFTPSAVVARSSTPGRRLLAAITSSSSTPTQPFPTGISRPSRRPWPPRAWCSGRSGSGSTGRACSCAVSNSRCDFDGGNVDAVR